MKVKISDLLDSYQEDTIPLEGSEALSARNIRARTLECAGTAKHKVRPIRRIAVLAAAAALMVTVVGAAGVVLRQAQVHFFDTEEDLTQALAESGRLGSVGYYGGADYGELQSVREYVSVHWDNENWTVLEEVEGTAQDRWSGKRTMLDGDGDEYSIFVGPSLSAFDSCWPVGRWDTAWAEEHYAPVAGAQMFWERPDPETGAAAYFQVLGEFQGEGDTVFNLQCDYNARIDWDDQYQVLESRDTAWNYRTEDGVDVAVKTATANSGKTVFWAELYSGPVSFTMFGSQMERSEIEAVLDSLNLSALCAY